MINQIYTCINFPKLDSCGHLLSFRNTINGSGRSNYITKCTLANMVVENGFGNNTNCSSVRKIKVIIMEVCFTGICYLGCANFHNKVGN